MDIIKRLFPEVQQFAAPQRLLLIDFWSQSEDGRGRDGSLSSQMAETLLSLRGGIDHQRYVCTEQQIYEMPKDFFQAEYDGVAILPPIGHDRGTRDILSSLLTRQQAASKAMADRQPLLAGGDLEASGDDALMQFWSSIPAPQINHRDLAGFLIGVTIAAIPQHTAVTIILPSSQLNLQSTGQLRETVQRACALRFILELGGGWPGVHGAFQLAAVVFDKGNSGDAAVRLFKVPTERDTSLDDVVGDFKRLCKQQGGTTKYGYVMRRGLPASSTWLVEAHHPRWEQYLSELSEVGDVQLLRDLGRLRRAVMRNGLSQDATDWPMLHARQIARDGVIDFDEAENVRYYPEQPDDQLRLRTGDVLIREIYAHTDREQLRFAEFPKVENPWYLGPNMLLLRFRDDVEPVVRQYVLAYLGSSEAAGWIRARTTGVQLPLRLLDELPVPVPDKSILAAFAQVRKTHDQFQDWAQQLRDLESRLFSFSTLREACQELLTVSARAQQRVAAATATETLSWRVRNLYPHPVAFRWRTVETMEPGVERYLEVLRCAEACMAYTAILGFALTEAVGPERGLKTVSSHASALRERPGAGVTFGTWVSIIEELNSRRFRDLDSGTPFIEVTQFYGTNPDVKDAINALMQKRNAMSHDRSPSDFELHKALTSAESELEILLGSVEFLSRYPLRDISSARRIGRQQRGMYSCRDLVGDHPVPVTRNIEFEGETPAYGLHLVDQSGKPHFIEPWLVRQCCSKCKHEETYVLDRYLRDGTIKFKSLEYGHEIDASDRREELAAIGIALPPL